MPNTKQTSATFTSKYKFSLSLADRSPDINTFSFWWTEQWPAVLQHSWNGRIGVPWLLFATMSWKCIASSWGRKVYGRFQGAATGWDMMGLPRHDFSAGKSWGEERRRFKFWEPRWPRCFKHLEHPPTSSKSSWLKGHQGNLIRIKLISLQFTASQFTNSVLSERLVPCQKVPQIWRTFCEPIGMGVTKSFVSRFCFSLFFQRPFWMQPEENWYGLNIFEYVLLFWQSRKTRGVANELWSLAAALVCRHSFVHRWVPEFWPRIFHLLCRTWLIWLQGKHWL